MCIYIVLYLYIYIYIILYCTCILYFTVYRLGTISRHYTSTSTHIHVFSTAGLEFHLVCKVKSSSTDMDTGSNSERDAEMLKARFSWFAAYDSAM